MQGECRYTLSGKHWWPDGGSRCQSCGLVRRYLIIGDQLVGHLEGVLVDYAEYEKLASFLRQNLPTLNPKYCKDFMDRAYALLGGYAHDPACKVCGTPLSQHPFLGLPCQGSTAQHHAHVGSPTIDRGETCLVCGKDMHDPIHCSTEIKPGKQE